MTFCISKRSGLDKAIHQIEQALRRSKNGDGDAEDRNVPGHLSNLLIEARTRLPQGQVHAVPNEVFSTGDDHTPSYSSTGQSSSPAANAATAENFNTNQHASASADDDFDLDDAENPLLLLARASDLPLPVHEASSTSGLASKRSSQFRMPQTEPDAEELELRTFFGPFRPSLDVSQDIDPIDLGLVTPSEVDVLFNLFGSSP